MKEVLLQADLCNTIFFQCIHEYHVHDNVDQALENPFNTEKEYIRNLLYLKCWIDTVQWHLEDAIRAPDILPDDALKIKRRIDKSNQKRNDTVEKIDEWLIQGFSAQNITRHVNAKMNSESPAWIIDRLSILCLKIYHMEAEIKRADAPREHREFCAGKLDLLNQQLADLTACFNDLMGEIQEGKKYMKVYRQVKMYNDPAMNPVLYGQKKPNDKTS